jgi:hypothetical protein
MFPEAVTVGGEDVETQRLQAADHKLVALLIAAFQEYVAKSDTRIAALEAKIEALLALAK